MAKTPGKKHAKNSDKPHTQSRKYMKNYETY